MSSRHYSYDESPSKTETCKVCKTFKTWSNRSASTKPNVITLKVDENGVSEELRTPLKQNECPLDREELGRSTWSFLHTMAAYYPKSPSETQQKDMKQFISLLSKVYPCRECKEDFKEEILKDPPKTESRHELSQWMCQAHNKVNKKLGKPLFDCSLVEERWRLGWKDGSCD